MTIDVVWAGTQWSCTPVTAPDPEPSPLRVIAYSQNDPRWKNQIYAGNTTFGTNFNRHLVSCTTNSA